MIKPEPKEHVKLETPLRVEVNPRLVVKIEDGIVTLFSRGNTIRMTEWEFDEVNYMHAMQRLTEIRDRQRKARD